MLWRRILFSNTRSFNPVDDDFFIVQFNALTDPGGTTAPGGVGQVPIPSTLPLLLDGLAGFG